MIAVARPFRALLRRIVSESSGATLVEFAFVGPVLILMVMGIFDIAHSNYTRSVLHGAMQKAARDLTLESAQKSQSAIDAGVVAQVKSVMPNDAQVSLEKFSHFDFSDVGQPEEFTDQNGDGRCNNNEPYVDMNDNGTWDADRGKSGIGGARDVVVYEATVTFPRMFPMFGLVGLPKDVTISAATVLRNQPFDEQNDRITTVRNCP